MDRRDRKRNTSVIRSSLVDFARPRPTEASNLSPLDGSVAQVGPNVSVYCARCERWVDCYLEIEPHVALERHALLVHTD
jgi:hypothetical protein